MFDTLDNLEKDIQNTIYSWRRDRDWDMERLAEDPCLENYDKQELKENIATAQHHIDQYSKWLSQLQQLRKEIEQYYLGVTK